MKLVFIRHGEPDYTRDSLTEKGMREAAYLGERVKEWKVTNRRRNATYAFLIPAICVGFVVATMTECLFLPFEVFPAFAYWFAFGDIFETTIEEKEVAE